jgi:hypothetical protein
MRPAVLLVVGLIAAAAAAPPATRPLADALTGGALQSTISPRLGQQGLATPGAGLPAPRAVGDAAPVCRSQCAKDRSVCSAGDDNQCAERWTQCVSACTRGGS